MDIRLPKFGPKLKGLSPMMGLRGRLVRGLNRGENLDREKPSLVTSPSRSGPRGSELRLEVGVILLFRLSSDPLASPLESRGGRSRTVWCGWGLEGEGRFISLFSDTFGTEGEGR